MVWTIVFSMQGLTSDNDEEIEDVLNMLSRTHDGTYYMHETIDCNKEYRYTRPWFAWANSLFSELVLKYVALKKDNNDIQRERIFRNKILCLVA